MNPRHQVSRAAIELIERFEGYRRAAARLEDGRWTIGYGHTRTARQGAEVSEADAEALLIYDLMEISAKLNEWIFTPLTQNQFDALAAFAFNIGLDNFRRSNVLRRLNEGAMLRAAFALELWRKADFEGERIVVDALVRRRAAEKMLFLTPPGGFLPAPSAVLSPRFDQDFAGAAPVQTPVEVAGRMEGDRAVAERVAPAASVRPVSPEDDEPSASQVAAAAVTARLQSILEEADRSEPSEPSKPPVDALEPTPEPEPAVAVDISPVEASEPAPSPAFALTPPPETRAAEPPSPEATEERAEPGLDEPELFTSEPMSFEDFESRQVAHHEFEPVDDFAEVEPIKSIGAVPILMALGILGLILFSAGLFWIVSAKRVIDGNLFTNPMIVGGGLGVVGIACVASAVYFLLERLGGREEQ